jgi:hypothetical protein
MNWYEIPELIMTIDRRSIAACACCRKWEIVEMSKRPKADFQSSRSSRRDIFGWKAWRHFPD